MKRRLLVVLVSLLLAWIGLANPAEASAAIPSLHGPSYTYDDPSCDAPENYTAPERGPPVKGCGDITYDTVDLGSHGALASRCLAATSTIYAYDAPAPPAQVDNAGGMTSEYAGQPDGGLSSLQRWHAAAKYGDEVVEGLGDSRTYIHLTKGGSIRNVGTNATQTEFAAAVACRHASMAQA